MTTKAQVASQAEPLVPNALSLLGYFTDSSQVKPEYDPGLCVQCPLCLDQLTVAARRTHSLMIMDGDKSYFYRTHRHCAERAPQALEAFEHSAVDEIIGWEARQ